MPNDDNSLSVHLAKARSARNPDKLREHAVKIAKLPRSPDKLVPCTCGSADNNHKAPCPVYWRELRRRQRKEQEGQ